LQKVGVRPDAPTIETIVPLTFYEMIKFYDLVKSLTMPFFVIPAFAGMTGNLKFRLFARSSALLVS